MAVPHVARESAAGSPRRGCVKRLRTFLGLAADEWATLRERSRLDEPQLTDFLCCNLGCVCLEGGPDAWQVTLAPDKVPPKVAFELLYWLGDRAEARYTLNVYFGDRFLERAFSNGWAVLDFLGPWFAEDANSGPRRVFSHRLPNPALEADPAFDLAARMAIAFAANGALTELTARLDAIFDGRFIVLDRLGRSDFRIAVVGPGYNVFEDEATPLGKPLIALRDTTYWRTVAEDYLDVARRGTPSLYQVDAVTETARGRAFLSYQRLIVPLSATRLLGVTRPNVGAIRLGR